MSATHTLPFELFRGPVEMLDPGNGKTIHVERSPCLVPIVTAAAETRTVANPTQPGAFLTLAMKTDGGDCVVTFSTAYDESGSTTITFSDPGQFAIFQSVRISTTVIAWRKLVDYAIGNLGGLTATAAEINARAAAASRVVNVTDAASYAVLAADSGKVHVLPNLTADCTLTLPTAAAGLEYTFIGKGVAADAQSWIFSTGGANFYLGGLSFTDTDDPADTVVAVYPNGSSNDFMTILAPGGGTKIYMICDGTNWIVNGQVNGATAPTFSDT